VTPSPCDNPGWTSSPIQTKKLTYNEIRDGTPTQITEQTGFSGGITHPDGTTTQFFTAGLSSLVYKIHNPDGSTVERIRQSNPTLYAERD
jgi:hypothetical protein